jgi:hypothetical protein
VPQPDDGEQELVGEGQGERVAGADGAAASGAGQAGGLGGAPGRQQVGGEFVEECDGQAGEVAEDGRVLPEVHQPRDHGRSTAVAEGTDSRLSYSPPIAKELYWLSPRWG